MGGPCRRSVEDGEIVAHEELEESAGEHEEQATDVQVGGGHEDGSRLSDATQVAEHEKHHDCHRDPYSLVEKERGDGGDGGHTA